MELPDVLAAEAGNPDDEMLHLRDLHEHIEGIWEWDRVGAARAERLSVPTMSNRDAWGRDSCMLCVHLRPCQLLIGSSWRTQGSLWMISWYLALNAESPSEGLLLFWVRDFCCLCLSREAD